MNILNIYLKFYSFLFVIILLIGCNQPPQIPKVIDTIFLSPVGDSPQEITVNSKTDYVYVVNSNNKLSILQNTTLITTSSTGSQLSPSKPIVHETTGLIYLLNTYSNTVTILQESTIITTVTVTGKWPEDIAIDINTGLIYIIAGHKPSLTINDKPLIGGYITVMDGTQIVDSIYLGEVLTRKIKIDPINNYIYVGGVGGDLFVLKDKQVIKHYNFGSTIKSMAVNPRTGDVYAIYSGATHNLSQFRNGEVIKSVDVEGDRGTLVHLQVHPNTGDLYIVDYPRQEVVVVRNMKVRERIKVDWQPAKMAIDPLTNNVYLTALGWHTLTVIQNTKVITTMPMGGYPYGIAINPSNGWVYVANTNKDAVTVLGFENQNE